MRIFFVCQRVPFPPDRGDKITTFNEIRHLSAAHEVHVFCLGDGARDLDNIPGLRAYAKSVTAFPVNGKRSRLRALAALAAGTPLSVAAFNEAALHQGIRRQFDALRPDLIIVYSCNVAQYAEHFPQVPRIMQFADLDSLKWGQYAARATIPLAWIYAAEQRRLLAYERRIARSFSHALVCTAVEQRDFARLIPGAAVSLVGNGVDLGYFRSEGRSKRPGSMVFTGVMDYLPNVDAVLWLCDEILPLVRASVPAASLTICGSRPTARVRRLAKQPGVRVTGWVADTRPYLDEAEIFAAPLRMARGIQNKLLEGLAMGLPCVTSIAAWSGTVVAQGEGIVASDDPREFAAQAVRLLRDDSYRASMAQKARAAAERHYRWDAQMAHLDRAVAVVTALPAAVSSPALDSV
ncbi:MAG TPA: TIGR03087 family PEP-CTERM/XrtA system glycosyltransferase [Stellaceae bacterium]|jgi:sugar transferase (PEP-CTERM/EpsH1 system associated)